ncbi:hypothetical protein [uncultured Microbulbifer sp.]|uniref:hypothetical protein n=1 Tax=uncultured Microbulbifer sp. TaxID=348147 RepID=UPI00260AD31F|nr:hypothetical protein [uncultured Microbulbifer sp.]
MADTSLDQCIAELKEHWDGLNSQTIIRCRATLERLAATNRSETWLADLHKERSISKELYRDPKWGFMLLAHVETQGLYRVPHNHGDGWVFYALQFGQVQMATYGLLSETNTEAQLLSRGADIMHPGNCRAFLPGDIHDTRCMSDYSLMFRLTSCDFSREKRLGRLRQFESYAE